MANETASRPAPLRRYAPHAATALAVFAVLFAPGAAFEAIDALSQAFLRAFDWLVLWGAGLLVVLCIGVAVSPVGALRLGAPDDRPEFSMATWFAMLFAAGMGAGLVFWGAAEPLIHAAAPPPGTEGADAAMAIALLHWAVHPWAIYAVSALAVAYFAFRQGAPLAPSAPLGGRGLAARLIDWTALIAVLFGVVASLGQGVIQMGAGVAAIGGATAPDSLSVQLILLGLLTAVYMVSAMGGLKYGIRPLSDLNMVLALVLLGFVLIAGPTGFILKTAIDGLAAYVSGFVGLSVDLRPEGPAREWTRSWTLTYLLWWVAWGPFVGVFIARISRGRTVREFLFGVVLAPSVLSWLWFAAMGGAGLFAEGRGLDLGVSDFASAPLASYALADTLPFALGLKIGFFLLVFIFLVTSADSGAYVLAMFSDKTRRTPPRPLRAFWGLVLAGLTAGAVLSGGGQNATRAFAVAGAIPLFFLLMWQTWRLAAALWRDRPR